MKKLLVALSFMAVLVFMGTPSMALVGTPDAVPGTHVLQPFFLVSIDGNLDTLSVVYDVKDVAGTVYVTMRDKLSRHVWNKTYPYSKRGTIKISIKGIIDSFAQFPAGYIPDPSKTTYAREQLLVDLDGNGVWDHYMGYLTFDNSNAWDPEDPSWRTSLAGLDKFDNLVGKMYLVELVNGKAAGANIPARELAYRNRWLHGGPFTITQGQLGEWGVFGPLWPGWWVEQHTALKIPYDSIPSLDLFSDYEVWTAFAYATSKAKECGYNPHVVLPKNDELDDPVVPVPAYMRLLPRFYLFNDNAENVIFVWSSANMGSLDIFQSSPDNFNLQPDIIREDEEANSITINLPHELNYINIATKISGLWTPPVGGWVDIRFDVTKLNLPFVWPDNQDDFIDSFPQIASVVPLLAEWLAYSYQTASNADASLNWGALFETHRDIGTFINLIDL
jgi:hypothetical protein